MATSAKVLIPDLPLPAVASRSETPVTSVDDGRDDDTRPSDLAPTVGAWTVGRGCTAGFLFFRLALSLPPPVTVVNPTSSADNSTVYREVSLAARDRACTVLAAAAVSVVGGSLPLTSFLATTPPTCGRTVS